MVSKKLVQIMVSKLLRDAAIRRQFNMPYSQDFYLDSAARNMVVWYLASN